MSAAPPPPAAGARPAPRRAHPAVSTLTSIGVAGVASTVLASTWAHFRRDALLSRNMLRARIMLLGTTTAFFAAGSGVIPVPQFIASAVHAVIGEPAAPQQ
jgi:hypothetical protein